VIDRVKKIESKSFEVMQHRARAILLNVRKAKVIYRSSTFSLIALPINYFFFLNFQSSRFALKNHIYILFAVGNQNECE
jgi:hypothetical protein